MAKVKCPCNCFGYKAPAVAVDAIVLKNKSILLIRRRKEPYKGFYALPGGFIECGESCEEAIKREVYEEVGINIKILDLLGVYSNPERDPRGHVISICYVTMYESGELKESEEAENIKFFNIEEALNQKLAFDHKKILEDFVRKYVGILI